VQLALPLFEGPVDALLDLVNRQKVPVDEIQVACVTAQCLSHVRDSGEVDLVLAGDLMAASARLMAIKSARLLAEPEIEADEGQAEVRPDALERERFAQAAATLRRVEGRESLPPLAGVTVERRCEPWAPELLRRAWGDVQRRVAAPVKRLAIPTFVRLEVAVSRLIRHVRAGSVVPFRRLVSGASRQDTVVHFLAVLELVRRGLISARQEDGRDDIILEWVKGESESSSRAG
jgi:segregation and condensation protein A